MGRGNPINAFLLGAAFAFGWTPCIGPILGSILTMSATSMDVGDGIVLLSIYSAGLALPFLLVAVFMDRFMDSMPVLRRIGRPLQVVAGAVLVLVAIGLATGYLNTVGTWLLRTFPFFQEILL